jgi:hypothetical protein
LDDTQEPGLRNLYLREAWDPTLGFLPMHKPNPSPLVIAAGASLVVSLIWVGLAWRTPTSTFHFAPLIAGVIGPYAAKSRTGVVSPVRAFRLTSAGMAAVAASIAFLAAVDRLRGPTFWSADGAAIEAALFGGLGALAGLAYLLIGASVPDPQEIGDPASS